MMSLFNFVPNWFDPFGKALDTKMLEAGKAGVAIARDLVPIRTGKLHDSIGFTYDQSRKLLILHADMPYAAVVEEGSIYQMARPYLRPALNEVGRIWGGNIQISYPNAYHLSGKKGPAHIAEYNRATSKRLHKGASRRAKVRYQWSGIKGNPGQLQPHSREHFHSDPWTHPVFDATPIV